MAGDIASDEQRPFVDRAQRAVNRGAALTQRLLALGEPARTKRGRLPSRSRATSGYSRKQPLLPKDTDLDLLIVQTCDMLQQTLGEKFELAYAPTGHNSLWRVNIDGSQMENALLNLAINARDAMPDGGTIAIEAKNTCFEQDLKERNFTIPAGDYVAVTVTDPGLGMQQDVVSRIFEPFYTTKEVGSGTGLGLIIIPTAQNSDSQGIPFLGWM